ncbi:MAG: LpxA family transferase [candidate division NC10 bacterium]|nr:LpxA family transferase [candidate division NC10 bacterium]
MSESAVALPSYIADALATFPLLASHGAPWSMVTHAAALVRAALRSLGSEYTITDAVAIHHSAVVEPGAVIRGPAIVSRNCTVAAHAYLRGGVFLDEDVRIGTSCEVKASFIFRGSALAHLNYAGDSLIGASVNLEAGAVLANHFNERTDKRISVVIGGRIVPTGVEKFGALVGDGSRIGANAVTTPGTVLPPQSVVGRLALVDQVAEIELRRHDGPGRDSR